MDLPLKPALSAFFCAPRRARNGFHTAKSWLPHDAAHFGAYSRALFGLSASLGSLHSPLQALVLSPTSSISAHPARRFEMRSAAATVSLRWLIALSSIKLR